MLTSSLLMKNKTCLFLVAVMLLFVVDSCQHRYPVSLVEADSLVYFNPKAALQKLDSISLHLDTTEKADVMYLRLLKMTVKDKLYMSFGTLDSVQSLARYYEEEGDKHLLPRAYYMLGRNFYNMHDAPQAFTYYRKVLDLLDENDDVHLKGFLYSQVGYMMRDQGDLEQALSFYDKALACHHREDNLSAIAIDLRDMALAKMKMGQAKSAKTLLYKALRLVGKEKCPDVVDELKLQLANYYLYNTNDLDSVWCYLAPSLEKNKNYDYVALDFVASEYYWAREKDEMAAFYLSQIMRKGECYDKQEAARRLVLIETSRGNMQNALPWLEKYLEYQDSARIVSDKEHQQNGLALFNYVSQQEKIQKLEKRNVQKMIGIIILVLVVFVIFFVLIFYFQMSIVRKLQLKNKINELRLFSSSKGKPLDAQQKIKEGINLDEYLSQEKHFSEEDWKKLETKVNLLYNGFTDRLYACLALSDNEFHICLLVKIGIRTKDIALLTSHTRQAISMAKQRLYKKITNDENGKAEDLDEFVKNL